MKKFSLLSVVALSLLATSACSIFYGKDKNELQPKLNGGRQPLNQSLLETSPAVPGTPVVQPAAPALAQQPGQPETFFNQSAGGLNYAPAVTPDMVQSPDAYPQTNPGIAPAPIPAPQPMITAPIQPRVAPVAPQQPTVIAEISKKKRLPASLQATYNNPLNSSAVANAPVVPQGYAPQQPVAPQAFAPVAPAQAAPRTLPASFAPAKAAVPAPLVKTTTTTTTTQVPVDGKVISTTHVATIAPAPAPANKNVVAVTLPTQPVDAPTSPVDSLQTYTTQLPAEQQ